ncbi:MAG: DNA repair protein RecN [Coriobacteriia bacterium]|nr:DNA repair protein RecN [Coriobacteriia bacterium]
MLDELLVNNYALIEQASIEFSPSYTVLTGETGAGKTALVGAIKLLIGERADVGSITDGTDELRVSARLLDQAGEETIVSRRLNRSGRSRANINNEMATVGTLSELIGSRFDLLGQHEHQSLLSTSRQLSYLDQFGGHKLSTALSTYQDAWKKRMAAADELAAIEALVFEGSRSLEEARSTIEAIEAVDPQAGEYEQLLADLPILRRGEDLAISSHTAWDLLRAEGQSLDLVSQALRILTAVKGVDRRLDDLTDRLESSQIDLEDIASELVAYRDNVSFDASALEETLDRLGRLEALMRRLNTGMDDVFDLYDQAKKQIDLVDNLPERLKTASLALDQSEQELQSAAAQLSQLRLACADDLAKRLTKRLTELAFTDASIEARCDDLDRSAWTINSTQRFELLFRPQARSSPRPLARIASGGELSRVMLALKSELIANEGLTLVFDEVDAGIGGQAASAVALYLRRLADVHQIIVVTHLAQIAALADRQYVVQKTSEGSQQSTSIFEVSGEDRVVEIARMLSGSSDDVALAHARELLGSRIET